MQCCTLLHFHKTLSRNSPIQKDLPTAQRLRFLTAGKTFCPTSGIRKKLAYSPPLIGYASTLGRIKYLTYDLCYTDAIGLRRFPAFLSVAPVVAFAPSAKNNFQNFGEYPHTKYYNDYVSHIVYILSFTTCKGTKKSRDKQMYLVNYQCYISIYCGLTGELMRRFTQSPIILFQK